MDSSGKGVGKQKNLCKLRKTPKMVFHQEIFFGLETVQFRKMLLANFPVI